MPTETAPYARQRRGQELLERWQERLHRKTPDLEDALGSLVQAADLQSIAPDPLQNVLRYEDPVDQEVAGLLTSAWAWGRASSILEHTARGLDCMDPSPAEFARRAALGRVDLSCFRGLRHRLHAGGDWASLVLFAGRLLGRHGSLGAAFTRWWVEEGGIRGGLVRLRRTYREGGTREEAAAAGLELGDADHLVADAAAGSACKRLNLWLRWMVRKDHIDPGPWRRLAPRGPGAEDLVIPLDVHVARLGQYLGMTDRKSPGWTMAEEITSFLAGFDPADPVRYDFALCRLGILEVCPSRRDPAACSRCPIYAWCRL